MCVSTHPRTRPCSSPRHRCITVKSKVARQVTTKAYFSPLHVVGSCPGSLEALIDLVLDAVVGAVVPFVGTHAAVVLFPRLVKVGLEPGLALEPVPGGLGLPCLRNARVRDLLCQVRHL